MKELADSFSLPLPFESRYKLCSQVNHFWQYKTWEKRKILSNFVPSSFRGSVEFLLTLWRRFLGTKQPKNFETSKIFKNYPFGHRVGPRNSINLHNVLYLFEFIRIHASLHYAAELMMRFYKRPPVTFISLHFTIFYCILHLHFFRNF